VATAARDIGRVLLTPESLSEWATQQIMLVGASKLDPERKALCAEVALRNHGSIRDVPVASWGGEWLDPSMLRGRFARVKEIAIFLGEVHHEEYDYTPAAIFRECFEPSDTILFIPEIALLTRPPTKGQALGESVSTG